MISFSLLKSSGFVVSVKFTFLLLIPKIVNFAFIFAGFKKNDYLCSPFRLLVGLLVGLLVRPIVGLLFGLLFGLLDF